ncbi:hypothetical protein PC119_g13397 [Phytophthora cactorum]|nr:hypothetical protein PC119_g13397 [Phytophthora cactorum]
MLGASPAQATFGRDMIVDVQYATDWQDQHARKVEQARKNNQRENAGRRE